MSNHDSDPDRTAELLAASLADEAATVQASPGALQEIQRRTSTEATSARGRWVWAVAGAGVATAAVITAVVLVSGNGSDPGTTPAAGAPSSSIAADMTVTISYLGPKPGSPEGTGPGADEVMPRLFTESRVVADTGQAAGLAAVHEFLTSQPADPDYSTGWPSGVDVQDITTADGVTTIDLQGDADLESPGQLDSGQARSAIQAIIATSGVTTPVRFVYNGQPLTTLLGHDVSEPVTRMSDDDTRAWISIDNISEGQTVSNPVSIDISGNVFEGNVNWTLTDANGADMDEGYATTSMGSWTKATVELGQLDPGTYTFKAYELSAADGSEINADTKTFTVS